MNEQRKKKIYTVCIKERKKNTNVYERESSEEYRKQ